jgi:hypothetical protein
MVRDDEGTGGVVAVIGGLGVAGWQIDDVLGFDAQGEGSVGVVFDEGEVAVRVPDWRLTVPSVEAPSGSMENELAEWLAVSPDWALRVVEPQIMPKERKMRSRDTN